MLQFSKFWYLLNINIWKVLNQFIFYEDFLIPYSKNDYQKTSHADEKSF